jgi:hypothetical protein
MYNIFHGNSILTKGVFGGKLSVPVSSFFPITDLEKTLISQFFPYEPTSTARNLYLASNSARSTVE